MSEYIIDNKWIDDFISNIEELIGEELWYDSMSNPVPPLKRIVRCRDCGWFCEGGDVFATNDWCRNFGCETQEDGYCAWSKRRADA